MIRTSAQFALLLLFITPGCDTGVNSRRPSAPAIESVVAETPDCFRFVVCRASNIRSVAIDRLDMLAEKDTTKMIKERFVTSLSKYVQQNGLAEIDAQRIAEKHSDIFQSLATKMTVESKSSAEVADSYAAYQIATLKHETIEASIEPIVDDIAEQFDLAKEDHRELLTHITSSYTVGWAGNDSAFVFTGFSEPEIAE